MSKLYTVGRRVEQIRIKLGLSQRAFAQRVGCAETMLENLERGSFADGNCIFSILERIAREGNVPTEALLFEDTNLFDLRISQLKVRAWELISRFKLTTSVRLIGKVFDLIEYEHDLAMSERKSTVLAYRDKDQAFQMDESRIRELVRRAVSQPADSEETQ